MSQNIDHPIRVLIVDDSSQLRKIIEKYANGDIRCEFVQAENGADAETLLQESVLEGRPIDLVFLDWMMPTFSGYEFLKSIRSVETFQSRPAVVMLTAETYSNQINACLKYNVLAYLTKPFTRADIQSALQKYLASVTDKERFGYAV